MNNDELWILNIIDDIFYLIDEFQKSIINNDVDFNKIVLLVDKFDNLGRLIDSKEANNVYIHEFNDKLRSALFALEENDLELFSDILVYEIKPLIEYWKQIIVS